MIAIDSQWFILPDYYWLNTPDSNTINNSSTTGPNGTAYIFSYNEGTWEEMQKISAEDDEDSPNYDDYFGWSVSIDGNYAVVGTPGLDMQLSLYEEAINVGGAYIFENVAGVWQQIQKLSPADGDRLDEFGYSVAISENYIFIGARSDDDAGTDSGSIYVYKRNASSGIWEFSTKLTASDGAENNLFGCSVDISGDIAVVGSLRGDYIADDAGGAYIFENIAGTWTQVNFLVANDAVSYDSFGQAVAIDGNYVLVGAGQADASETGQGVAYIFTNTGSAWELSQKLVASDGSIHDGFGYRVSIYGNQALIGASGVDGEETNTGGAYLFTENMRTWVQTDRYIAGDGKTEDCFGCAVTINGNNSFIGAFKDDDNGIDSGSLYLL